jgi:isoquinoline 1-oxidoreductase subunit beta
LIWTREEDIRHDRFRPQAAISFRAGFDAGGAPTGLEIHTVVGSLPRSLGLNRVESGIESMAVEGLANSPYAIANTRVECSLKNTHIPVSCWRSLGSSQNAFAIESFINEMAHAAGEDPYYFQRKLLTHRADFINVPNTLAEKSGWERKLPATSGRGIAIHECCGSVVGAVAEVAVANGQVKVTRAVVALDCGHAVNPLTVAEQLEGGTVRGLPAALFGKNTVKDGAIVETNFDTYPVVRMADSPKIETYLPLTGGKKWGGVG